MSSDIAVKVENLSKCYQLYNNPRDRLLQMLFRGRRQYYREFWALKDVSFQVRKGETIGIIGRNGSGKSTLLQLICGTLNPTSGLIETHGRIAALLELGSGFNPEFTGRENVYMNASVLGLSKQEIDERFDDIVDFADIGDFIEQPVKTYSSGMMLRLAFGVQSQVNPDILIVDEALAVGDARFQAKCFDRLRKLKENGTSILLVTHSSEQVVTHCSKALLLNGGMVVEAGEPRHVVNCYLDLLFGKEREGGKNPETPDVDAVVPEAYEDIYHLSCSEDSFHTRPCYNPNEYRWGDGKASILDFYLSSGNVVYPSAVSSGETITLVVNIKINDNLFRPVFGMTIKTKEGVAVYGANSETLHSENFQVTYGENEVIQLVASFSCRLAQGDYFVSLGISTKSGEEVIPHDRRYDSIHLQVGPCKRFFGLADLELKLTEITILPNQ